LSVYIIMSFDFRSSVILLLPLFVRLLGVR
jgi:hypothetical protein